MELLIKGERAFTKRERERVFYHVSSKSFIKVM